MVQLPIAARGVVAQGALHRKAQAEKDCLAAALLLGHLDHHLSRAQVAGRRNDRPRHTRAKPAAPPAIAHQQAHIRHMVRPARQAAGRRVARDLPIVGYGNKLPPVLSGVGVDQAGDDLLILIVVLKVEQADLAL
jgi:hypothetical protein